MTEISATVEHEDADLANMGQKNRELHGRLTALQQDKTSAELKLAEANHALESVGGKGEEAKQSALLQPEASISWRGQRQADLALPDGSDGAPDAYATPRPPSHRPAPGLVFKGRPAISPRPSKSPPFSY